MAYTTIEFENPRTGAVKTAPVGFSWTTMFFGFCPAFFRSDWKWGFIQLILALFTFGASSLVFMFIYNKIYIKELIGDGFKAKSVENGNMDATELRIGLRLPQMGSAALESAQ